MTLVLVETDRPGFKRGRNLKKIGQNAQDTAELFFEDVRVPPSNILGEEGRGFACLMNQLPRERMLVAIGAVAIMEAALEWTIDYTRERKAFGKAIADFQNTRFKLAEVKTEVTVARVFLNHCLELFLAGELDATTAAMAKWWLAELDKPGARHLPAAVRRLRLHARSTRSRAPMPTPACTASTPAPPRS